MIVNHRIELSDGQRNALARLNKPSAPKRLATRDEVRDFINGCIAALEVMEEPERQPQPATVSAGGTRLQRLMDRAMEEDGLHDKSESYLRGWCKVKYADQLGPRN